MEKLSVEYNGKKLEGYAQIIQGKLWIHFDGKTYAIESTKGNRRRKSVEGKSSTSQVLAPMPGKVTRVFVEEGQSVSVGQAVIVMEAMKMEYTLKSEIESTVEKINAKVGDQVQLGQILIKLKEA